MFKQWSQAYKAKMALKAVARARYLRLPLAVSRQPAPQPRTLGLPASTSSISSYRRPISRPEPDPQPVTETEEESDIRVFDTGSEVRMATSLRDLVEAAIKKVSS